MEIKSNLLDNAEKTVFIGGDHAGISYKKAIFDWLTSMQILVKDFGPFVEGQSVDYPDFAHAVAAEVNENKAYQIGILICGSGNGVAITANKYANVRAALCWNSEIAALARQHNDANVLCIPARFTTEAEALEIVKAFVQTAFEGGRHQNRVNKIPISCA